MGLCRAARPGAENEGSRPGRKGGVSIGFQPERPVPQDWAAFRKPSVDEKVQCSPAGIGDSWQ